jgi:hypothetical protein
MPKYKKHDRVTWRWGAHSAHTVSGEIVKVFTDLIEWEIGRVTIVHRASPDQPAYLIRQADGLEALKFEHELL